ncbi:hypothetical protein D9Q98_010443 [Chlorella vulgaris]|uniref:Uncharacterized protein n=1 Tax=Chlorella vulgaris TaxID=3077 RepID=A0A9D4TRS1_CHLVU|nr:hypothetical protein D9Q98_010443 [Chlorella vulgaris]
MVFPTASAIMDRPPLPRGPAGAPGPVRIPSPTELQKLRHLRQQQQQRQRQQNPLPHRHHPRVTQPPPPAQQPPLQTQPIPQQQKLEQLPLLQQDGGDQQSPASLRGPMWRMGSPSPAAQQLVAAQPALQQQQQQQKPLPSAEQQPRGPQWRLGGTPPPGRAQPGQQLAPAQHVVPLRRAPVQRHARTPKGGHKDPVFAQLAQECTLEDAWRPQVLLLYELGMRASDFQRLTASKRKIFQIGIVSMRRKLKFLQDTIGLSNEELTKVIAKFPRILEYKSERTFRPRLDFLKRCGVEQEDLVKVFTRAPMVMELRVKDTLEPRASFLRDILCLSHGALGKLIVRHPQVLTCTEDMMRLRVDFLLLQGLSQEDIGKAVSAHPHVLHYKIDSMQERVSFLLSIGLDQAQVAACISRFPQLFSLNVEANLEPKWRYLEDYIRTPADSVATLCSYPAFFSLSLMNRVVPRHRYFLHVQSPQQQRGAKIRRARSDSQAFQMKHLKCSDAQFAKLIGRPVEEYEAFKSQLFGDSAQPLP